MKYVSICKFKSKQVHSDSGLVLKSGHPTGETKFQKYQVGLNSLPNDKFLASTKFKAFADSKLFASTKFKAFADGKFLASTKFKAFADDSSNDAKIGILSVIE